MQTTERCPNCGSVTGQLGLTKRQAECKDTIRDLMNGSDMSPSLEEIAAAMNKSKSSACRLVHGLVQRGHAIHVAGHRRSLRLL